MVPAGRGGDADKARSARAAESEPGQRVLDLAPVDGMHHGRLAGDRGGADRAHARQPAQAILDDRDLGRAAHALDVEDVRLLVFAARAGRGLSAQGRPRLAARVIRTAARPRPSSAAWDMPMSTSVRMCSSCRR